MKCNHPPGDYCVNCVDLNDPPLVNTHSPHAAFKHLILRRLGSMFDLKVFVETGTNRGDTIDYLRDFFDEIHSIELHPDLYNYAVERFSGNDHIYLVHGNSGVMLAEVLKKFAGPCLMWIDAHPTGGPSANEGIPLDDELRTIYKMAPNSLVVVDDAWPEDVDRLPKEAGWTMRWYHGLVFIHREGLYNIPERF